MPTPNGISRRKRREQVPGFSPLNLFAASEVGLWYDPSDLTPEKLAWVAANPGFTSAQFLAAFPTHTLYQNAAGTTPVTALGQPVGLVIDKSKGGLAALGSELVSNGDFSNGSTGWTLPATAVVTNGALVCTGMTSASNCVNAGTIVAGRWYRATFEVRNYVAGSIGFGFGTQVLTPRNANGVYTEIFYATVSDFIDVRRRVTDFTGTVDNISVREVPGVHATQGTDAARPTLQARANLLLRSEQFTTSPWVVDGITLTANSAVAPDGTTTATTAVQGTGNNRVLQFDNTGILGNKVFSLFVKANAGSSVVIQSLGGMTPAAQATVNIANGTVSGFTGATVASAGDGWLRVSLPVNVTVASGNSTYWQILGPASSVYIWGADLRLGTSAGTYQRVVTATDYADVGLPRSLTFDGTDDSLVTPSVNFTATDKMTVCAGVFKQTDSSSNGTITELSVAADSNAGAFFLRATSGGLANYQWMVRSATTNFSGSTLTPSATAPDTSVLTLSTDLAAPLSISYRNGIAPAVAASSPAGGGTFGNYPLYLGRRASASLPFNGRIHQLIVRGAATDTATIQQTERFVAQKTGIAI